MASICSDDKAMIPINMTTHQFKVNYSKIKDMSIGQLVTSPTFKFGDYKWAINFYPKGCRKNGNDGVYASLFLKLLDDHTGLKTSFTLGIFPGDEYEMDKFLLKGFNTTFSNSEKDWGLGSFISRATLEKEYLTNGFFVVFCNINVKDKVKYEFPKGCLCGAFDDISNLLKTTEMADVKFEVEGQVFSAHRLILGARSPVFKAELFGSMSEAKMNRIEIKDMKPEVFKALLHFAYTYLLPDNASADMVQHLLVAADRYAIEGLITRCEEWLINNISLDTVLGFLICAERHNFNKLKSACVEMVAEQKNFNELALSEDYCVMMQEFPSLLAELRKRIIPS